MANWSGTFGVNYTPIVNRNPNEKRLAKMLRQPGMRKVRAKLAALLGAAVGETAAKTYTRVQAIATPGATNNLGGVRTFETVTVINRATTAADLAALQSIVDMDFRL